MTSQFTFTRKVVRESARNQGFQFLRYYSTERLAETLVGDFNLSSSGMGYNKQQLGKYGQTALNLVMPILALPGVVSVRLQALELSIKLTVAVDLSQMQSAVDAIFKRVMGVLPSALESKASNLVEDTYELDLDQLIAETLATDAEPAPVIRVELN